MKRRIVQTKSFDDEVSFLIAKRKLSEEDFEDFKKSLVENPSQVEKGELKKVAEAIKRRSGNE